MKLLRRILLGLLVIIAAGGITVYFVDAPLRQEIQELTIADVDFSQLSDGIYTGSFSGIHGNSRDVTLQVTIKSGVISSVTIISGAIDQQGNPTEVSKGLTLMDLFEEVQQAKSLDVDLLSGATLTSKTHLKALENALNQALKE